MPRIARIIGIGLPHHVVQRGNNKEIVFIERRDYEKYLFLLKDYSQEKKLSIIAYCLMPNHVHLLVRPLEEKSLPKMMQCVSLCYTQYFNKSKGRSGRLWESRYYSTTIDEDRYLWAVSKYIEVNPVRASIVEKPEDYPYSSAKAHILGKLDPLLNEDLFTKININEYRKFIQIEDERHIKDEIRSHTRSGKPLGDSGLLKILSEKFGYNLTFRPKGRPKHL